MSWMAKLYESYDHIVRFCTERSDVGPWPISHFVKNAHIEIVIDNTGGYLVGRTKVLDSINSPTLIPATESSVGRSGAKIAPHPLCEEIGYCALDYPDANREKNKAYMEQLRGWANSAHSPHHKISAIYKYLSKGTLWKDLSNEHSFPLKVIKSDGSSQKIAVEKVFIRWRVEEPGNPVSGTWEDENLIESWMKYDHETNYKDGFCYIEGNNCRVALNHPRFLRRPGDVAKLVSSNDSSGFTFRGKFTDTKKSIEKAGLQSVEIGFDVTQKAHNALRWLISNQGTTIGASKSSAGSVVLAWAVSGADIPQPMDDIWDNLNDIEETYDPMAYLVDQIDHAHDLGQSFSIAMGKYMRGYRAKLQPTDSIVILGMDSATPGRMAVTYYQELFPDEYIDRISQWHEEFAWPQCRHLKKYEENRNSSSHIEFPCAPSPQAIWEAAYGKKIANSLKKSTAQRILPCIIEAKSLPHDLVNKAIDRAGNRSIKRLSEQYSNWKSEQSAWERDLSVACSLYKGFSKRCMDQGKEYEMSLEENRKSRDYLYGRLLAIAERIEEMAMIVAKEKVRTTHASRLMQRFADHPASTWLTIEKGINPYQQRLRNNIPPLEDAYRQLLDNICAAFEYDDFTSSGKLTGEYLLGYHCQRKWLREHKLKNGEWLMRRSDNDDLQIEGDEE
ncbi:MAG: type I-C CRISPR-associated protein Cas8c/Csd1 [Candidatus Thiodiazotropha sp. (ex Ustalcina ferruginea)]|nr:type I-C CRISPR-associated protein Cas8c/Csd1 [Candidatus Thiodiazotropha sp. (ex Ustalcina ferruginea)]